MREQSTGRTFRRPHRPANRQPTGREMTVNAIVWAAVIVGALAFWSLTIAFIIAYWG